MSENFEETGAAYVAAQLHAAGISTLFGVMGDGNVDLVGAAVENHGMRYIAARHEQGCVSMAEGFAHSTNTFGVATVTYGPGVANTITALTSAVRHHARLLMVCGHRTGPHGPPQYHVPHDLLCSTGVIIIQIDDPQEVPGSVRRAIDTVAQSQTPVVLTYADHILEGPWRADTPLEGRPAHTFDAASSGSLDSVQITKIAAALRDAQRPVILAGRGARDDGAGPAIMQIAERTGAALLTSLLGHGTFGDHPQALGISGGLSSAEGRIAMGDADLVLVLGCGLNGWTLNAGSAFEKATMIHVDIDEQAHRKAFRKAERQLVGGAKDTADRILEQLVGEVGRQELWWRSAASAQSKSLPLERNGRLDPLALAAALDRALPVNRALTVDGGHFFEALCRSLRVADERAFFWTLGFGSVGLGLATAIGAAVGRPDRLTVAGIGDGGLMMSLPELETVARYQLPILVLVMNDASYGAEEKLLQNKGWPAELARFPESDFSALGKALGIESVVLKSAADVEAVLPRLGKLEAPFLIDARIDQSENAHFIELLHRLKAVTN